MIQITRLQRGIASFFISAVVLLQFAVTPVFAQTTVTQPSINDTISAATSWLSDTNAPLLQCALGVAGKSAPPQSLDVLLNRIASEDYPFTLITLSQAVLNTTFSGYHAANILGTNLLQKLLLAESVEDANLEALSYCLLAYNSNPYEVSSSSVNSPEALVAQVLTHQNEDGGFSSQQTSSSSSVTSTALALTALSPHRSEEGVEAAIQAAIAYFASIQQADGSFLEGSISTTSPTALVITSLESLGISYDDPRFVKEDQTLLTVLLQSFNTDGGFSIAPEGDSDVIATQNAIFALVAIKKQSSPFIMEQSLPESTYVPTVPEELAPTIDEPTIRSSIPVEWGTALFMGLYLTLFLLLVIYLCLSRFHPLLYWEQLCKEREGRNVLKYNRAHPTYEEPPTP